MIWRKHWLVLIPRLWFPLVITILWVALGAFTAFGPSLGEPPEWQAGNAPLQFVFALLFLISLVWTAWVIADWRNDTYEITDDEIARTDRMPLGISENRKSAALGRIQNVEMTIPSILHMIFNFGHVRCQTAAEEGGFLFYAIPDPRSVVAEIEQRLEWLRKRTEDDAAHARDKNLPDWFELYNRMGSESADERNKRLTTQS